MAVFRVLLASLLISLLVLDFVHADMVIATAGAKSGAVFRVGQIFVTERAGLAALGATACHRAHPETTTNVRAMVA
ncbi:unnamed protein product [Arabidopsis thaliana]|uniref:(thale cress) hypothetical protein n=1 Tax=Arabidopsis thaliana TaxID=3702 RepID=A0A178VRH4_ARATH|nr:hypothetical protein AXX17_AT2G13760 [Arabidopsis thaliana]CAD5318831.1 unnamed protein product [Arabidopsis thaliana]